MPGSGTGVTAKPAAGAADAVGSKISVPPAPTVKLFLRGQGLRDSSTHNVPALTVVPPL